MPDSLGVRDAITKPFSDSVLRHPIYRQPKGHLHMTISHGARDQIPGALGMRSRSPFTTAFYAIPSVHRQKDIPIRAFSMVLQNSRGGRHAIPKPFYDSVLRHPIYPPPKGRLHTSIFHGATDSSEGGSLYWIPGALSMRSRSPFTTAFYAIPSVHRQRYIPIQAFSMALQSVLKGEFQGR
ncbi:hypothetical protein B9Z19DRAFT_1197674 [Tuber borchii]|uniref:Uncharacterized protein n=1 Tax=Tuber borchii TaxID=42251 RepID=A0A2T6Z9S9_TUBBO|nr:hypothetical protein B9Z19DRAFT_1197674 [Tuber borchii]